MKKLYLLIVLSCLCATFTAVQSVYAYSPYATEIIDSGGPFGGYPYDDPAAVLGKPSTVFYDSWSGATSRIKLVEPAYSTDPDSNNLITTLNSGSFITVGFDHQIEDDPNNPYGIDFLVFGNSFYTGSGWVSDSTDMNNYNLTGGGFFENVTVSVSQDGIDWYTYSGGPFGDNAFPTQAYQWDAANAVWTDNEMDFTKPVDPSLAQTFAAGGMTAADAIAMYEGSGGGTGFDLAESGYDWIQYIKVEGTGGEIDAFADVAAVSSVPIPGAALLLASGLVGLVGFRRKR